MPLNLIPLFLQWQRKMQLYKKKTREEWNDDERRRKKIPPQPQNAECGQLGHMRFDCCPIFKRIIEISDKRNFKEKKEMKAYITWENNAINSSSDLENKIVSLGLMLKDYENGEEQS